MVAIKTLYTLASANQNSMHIASLRRETLSVFKWFETDGLISVRRD